jgi:hypothetical protein
VPAASPGTPARVQPVALEKPVAAPTETDAPSSAAADSAGEYQTLYVVVADTGRQYAPLRRQMLRLQAATGQRIDTMGRFYDPQRDLIRLPDNDEDEVYAGEYYPRRMPDATLSLEYADLYTHARPKSLALVTGIYEEPARADSLLAVVRRTVPTAFRLKSSLYMGCLH